MPTKNIFAPNPTAIKKSFLIFIYFFFYFVNSQEVVCEGAPCTSNDFTINFAYLGDDSGNEFEAGYCEPGTTVDANLWLNFSSNAAASRYDLYLHFNLYINGEFVATIDECYYDDNPIPANVNLNTYSFSWECGAEVLIQDVYMSWQTNNNGTCGCTQSHCFSDPGFVVVSPLIANFSLEENCDTPYTLDFTSLTTGGIPPYIYLWDFGDGTSSTLENPSHTYPSTGPYIINLTVTDAENFDFQEVNIVEFDSNVPPEINAPPNSSILGCSIDDLLIFQYSELSINISESDFIDLGGSFTTGNSIKTLSYVDTSTGSCPLEITRTFTLVDDCDRIVQDIQNILIDDNLLPTASNPEPITVQCIEDVPTPNVNVVTDEADNCGIPTVTFVSDTSDNATCAETITRTYRVTDDCGNSVEVTQNIIINDTTLPTASNPEPITVQCIEDVPNPNVNVVTDEADNCGIPTVTFVSDASDNATCAETITRTYRVTDDCGNSAEVTQNIIINDTTLPTASNPEPITVQCIEDVPTPNVNVVTDEADNCGIPTVTFVSDASDNATCAETITRTYRVTDACGNSVEVTQNIIINDTTLPTASNPEPITVQCIEDVPTPNVNVVTDEADNCGIPTVTFVSDASDNATCAETITRTYRVTDACGNSVEVTQNIIINDTTLPTASNPEPITVQCIEDVPTPNVNIVTDEADNCGIPTVTFVSDASDNATCAENITRTYRVTDACGNSVEVTQNIIINDTTLPTASNPEPITVQCIEDVPTPNVNVVTDEADNCGIPTVTFVSDASDNATCAETITRTYRVTDDCGNSVEVTQNIIINDTTLPTASNPEPITVQCIEDVPTPNVNVVTDEADNCGIPTVTFVSDASDNATCAENITRTYRVTDACGNSVEVTQNIIINDTTLPTASNPEPITVQCIEDVPTPNVNVVTDEADNCGIPTVTFVSDASDNATCAENITRTYRVTDACGNSVEVTQNIIINDTTLPTASNPEPITVQCIEDVPTPNMNVVTDEADNCGIPTVTFVSDASDNATCAETITRTYRVTDACGNSVEVTQNIIINDTIPPVLDSPFDQELSVNCNSIPSPPNLTFTDNCSFNITIQYNEVDTNVNNIDDYEIIRTWIATDDCGNESSFIQNINVFNNDCSITNCAFNCGGEDTTPPTASNPLDLVVDCKDNIPVHNINVVTDANDNCSIPVVKFVSEVVSIDCFEKITRTYSVTDECGNSIMVSHTISIIDNINPTASNPSDITVSCFDEIPTPNADVITDESDNCSQPNVRFISDFFENNFCNQTVIRTYRVEDICGNFIDVTQNIHISDNNPPTASNPEPITVQCIEDVPTPNVNIVTDEADNCGIPTVTFVSDASDNATCAENITRTYRVTDACGNSVEVTQNIIINDTTLPTASNPEPITVQCIEDVPTPNVNVVTDEADNCGIPTVTFVSDASDNATCAETITRTYRVTDDCGNSVEVTQNIIINDTTLPTASNPEPITVQCIEDVPTPNVNVVTDEADNCGIPTVTFVSDASDNATCAENITRTYRVTDACGNSVEVTQNIIINDTTLPTASNPEPITVQCIEDVPTPNVNVVTDEADNCGIPTVTFVSDASDNATCAENITRTYRVTDACGNSVEVTQNIIINDTTLPTASNPEPITVQCIEDVPTPNMNVVTDEADNCGIPTVTFVSDASDNATCAKNITRTYRVTDACGNSVEVTQNIIINDTTLPTASNPEPITVQCIEDVPTPNVNVVTDEADNCGIPTVTFVSDASDNATCAENITRTYRVTDACGNSVEVTQNIIINDTTLPTASNPEPITVQCIEDVPNPNVNVVTDEADNCGIPTVTFVSDASDNATCAETITRTYRVTDDCGNSVEVTQNIIINDTTLPTASNPEPITVQCIEDVPTPNVNVVTDEADNCGIPTVTFVSDASDNATCAETITRTYRVTDDCGNSVEVTQNIIINDTTLPTASNPEPITVQCIEDVPTPNVNVVTDEADNCGIPTVTFVSDASDNATCAENITRTYRVTDACGNSVEVTQNIIINDTIPPVLISNLQDLTVTCEEIPKVDDLIFEDNCSSIVTMDNFNETQITIDDFSYDIIRTWSVSDDCDNTTQVIQTLYIRNYEFPEITDINICLSDEPIDLFNYVNSTSFDMSEFESEHIDVLNGSTFNPSSIDKGFYQFTHTFNQFNCSYITTINIDLNDNCITYPCIASVNDISISRLVTPNEDNYNDYFKVEYNLNQYSNDNKICDIKVELQIFNRWGEKVFESFDYKNTWNGETTGNIAINSNGKLPTGTYFYIVKLNGSNIKPIQEYFLLGTK